MNSKLIRRKLIACMLVVAMVFSFMGGIVVNPSTAEAQGEFQLRMGSYRGLNQEMSIPISVRNAEELVAMEFEVFAEPEHDIDVAVRRVNRGADLPGNARIDWSGIGHNGVKVSIIWETDPSFSGDGEMVVIDFQHNATEQTYAQPIDLELKNVKVYKEADPGEADQLPGFDFHAKLIDLASNAVRDGKITVAIMYGDMNKNDEVTINDALLALRAAVGDLELTEQLKDAGDVKRSWGEDYDTVTVYDALLIARYAVGLIPWFPVEYDPATAEDDDDVDDVVSDFFLKPSSIWIGDYELNTPRTTIGGEVTFTVKFDRAITGDVKIELSGAEGVEPLMNSEFINGREVDITIDTTGQLGHMGDRVVSAFQYHTANKQEGVRLDRFVRVVDPDAVDNFGNPLYPAAELRIVNATGNPTIDFEWLPDRLIAASNIKLRYALNNESVSSLAWRDARTGTIKTTDSEATVTELDANRGYHFKLFVEDGVHAGISNIVRFNRMTGDAVADVIPGGDLNVIILYTGIVESVDTDAAQYFTIEDGDDTYQADRVEKYGSRGVKVIFEDYDGPTDDFTVKYDARGAARPTKLLDEDNNSYVLAVDSVSIGKSSEVTEVIVTSWDEFERAMNNDDVTKVVLGADITVKNGETLTLGGADKTVVGDGFSLILDDTEIFTIEVDEDARFEDLGFKGGGEFTVRIAENKTLTLDGVNEINNTTVIYILEAGAEKTGNSVTIKGSGANAKVEINQAGADSVIKDLTYEGDLDVVVETGAADITFKDVTFDGADLKLEADVTFEGTVTTDGVKLVDAARAISFEDNNAKWVTTGKVELETYMLTINNADGTVEGKAGNTVVGTSPGGITFAEAGLTADGVDFRVDVILTADAEFKNVAFASGKTISINTHELTLSGTITGKNATIEGTGTVTNTANAVLNNLTIDADLVIAGHISMNTVTLEHTANNETGIALGDYTLTVGAGGLKLNTSGGAIELDSASSRITGIGTISGGTSPGAIAFAGAGGRVSGVRIDVNVKIDDNARAEGVRLADGIELEFSSDANLNFASVASTVEGDLTLDYANSTGSAIQNAQNVNKALIFRPEVDDWTVATKTAVEFRVSKNVASGTQMVVDFSEFTTVSAISTSRAAFVADNSLVSAVSVSSDGTKATLTLTSVSQGTAAKIDFEKLYGPDAAGATGRVKLTINGVTAYAETKS